MLINLTTPALLFPAISLLLLAYTNRFLAIATLIRNLHQKHISSPEHPTPIIGQIENLRSRLSYIKLMQVFGVLSFFFCVLSMILLFVDQAKAGSYVFGGSMILLLISLAISVRELQISTDALNLELSDMELKKRL